MPWLEVRCGDGTAPPGETLDAIFVNAGVTHPQDVWLDALAPGAIDTTPARSAGSTGRTPV
jgi:protein-L-isoaspartate O-methyltransferase